MATKAGHRHLLHPSITQISVSYHSMFQLPGHSCVHAKVAYDSIDVLGKRYHHRFLEVCLLIARCHRFLLKLNGTIEWTLRARKGKNNKKKKNMLYWEKVITSNCFVRKEIENSNQSIWQNKFTFCCLYKSRYGWIGVHLSNDFLISDRCKTIGALLFRANCFCHLIDLIV